MSTTASSTPAGHRPQRRRAAGIIGGTIGVLGELMITLGLLLVLFLVWQLWWTDVVADSAQSAEITAVKQHWQRPADPQRVARERTDAPPTVPVAPTAQVFATLHIPAFDRDEVPLAEGVSREQVLNVKGAGHYPGTAMPGQVGNVAVAGHRTSYGKPFNQIDRLRPGDPVVIETAQAYYVYTVTGHRIVDPTQVEVVAPDPEHPGRRPTERLMTMTACHPLFSARERYVVHLRFAYWTARADGLPPALAGSTGRG